MSKLELSELYMTFVVFVSGVFLYGLFASIILEVIEGVSITK